MHGLFPLLYVPLYLLYVNKCTTNTSHTIKPVAHCQKIIGDRVVRQQLDSRRIYKFIRNWSRRPRKHKQCTGITHLFAKFDRLVFGLSSTKSPATTGRHGPKQSRKWLFKPIESTFYFHHSFNFSYLLWLILFSWKSCFFSSILRERRQMYTDKWTNDRGRFTVRFTEFRASIEDKLTEANFNEYIPNWR